MTKRSQIVAKLPADIDAIEPPKSGARWYYDPFTTPLRLRASRRGHTWIFHGRILGAPRRKPLGKYPRMSLEQARAAAQRIAAEGAPAAVPLTFGQLRLAYFESAEFKGLAERTRRSYKWVLESKDYESLSKRKLRDITRLDILAIKDKIAADGRAFQNVLRPVQALFSWALDRGLVDVSPASRLKLPLNQADPQPYTETEISDLLTAVRKAGSPWRELYLLTAYTGQRPSTWTEAKWNEINLKKGVLTVSRTRGRRSKLKKGWSVPLGKHCIDILKAMEKEQGRNRNEWLFGRRLVVEQKVRDRIAKGAGLSEASNRGTLHRFRATMLTKLDEWGIDVETAQRLAGHASPFSGARGHYVVPAPSPEMRKAHDRYTEWVHYCELL